MKIGRQSSTMSHRDSVVPYESVLELLLFTVYISPVEDIIRNAGVQHHQFSERKQHISTSHGGPAENVLSISRKSRNVIEQFRIAGLSRDLQLSPAKFEEITTVLCSQIGAC